MEMRPSSFGFFRCVAFILATSCLVISHEASNKIADPDALALTAETFDDALERQDRLLVNFYDVYCEVCEELRSTLQRGAAALRKAGLGTVVAAVNSSAWPNLAKRFDIQGSPTFLFYVRGKKVKTYLGVPKWMENENTFTAWVAKRELANVNVTAIQMSESVPHMNAGDLVLVARVKKTSTRKNAVWNASEILGNYDAFSVKLVAQWLPPTANAKTDAKLTLHRAGWRGNDSAEIEYKEKWVTKDIVAWVVKHAYPTLGTTYSSDRYGVEPLLEMDFRASVVAVVNDTADPKRADDIQQHMEAIITPLVKYFSQWLFTLTRSSTLGEEERKYIIGDASEPNLLVSVVTLAGFRFVLDYEKASDPDELEEFLMSVTHGSVAPLFISEPDPLHAIDDDGCLTLVGRTFETHVMDPRLDVFVLFTQGFGAGCIDCERVATEWSRVAAVAQARGWRSKGVILAKMDTTKNECIETVQRVPRLVFYPAVPAKRKLKNKADHRGPYTSEAMIKFVRVNAKNLQDDDHDEL